MISAGFDVIRDHAEKLSALAEHYDLPDIPSSTPSDLKVFYRDEKDRILRDRIMEQVDGRPGQGGRDPQAARARSPTWNGP